VYPHSLHQNGVLQLCILGFYQFDTFVTKYEEEGLCRGKKRYSSENRHWSQGTAIGSQPAKLPIAGGERVVYPLITISYIELPTTSSDIANNNSGTLPKFYF